jgi:hypothetical protein
MGYPGWGIFEHPDEAKHQKDNTFKITKTSSFGSPDELIEFKLGKDGQVEKMFCAGAICLPEKEYIKQTSKQKIIGEKIGPR